MTAKKTAKKTEKKKKDFMKCCSKNFWMVATLVLAALLIGTLINSNVTGAVIVSSEVAGQKVVDFAKSQGADATLVSVEDDGSLYEVVVLIEGQEIPVYITKDGKTLVPQPVSIDDVETQEAPEESTPEPIDVPKSDKPIVEAFIMSHCPYGTQIEKGLIPVMRLLDDKVDAQIKFVYYAMHPSAGEVQEQLNQYCIQEEQNDLFLDYLTCFLEAGDGAGCITSTEIDTTALTSCAAATDEEFNVIANLEDQSSWLSGQFPKFDIHKVENDKYQVGGSPTLVINGQTVSSGRDSASLLSAICAAFNTAPEECSTIFESGTPSPGFGYSTTDVTNNAVCG